MPNMLTTSQKKNGPLFVGNNRDGLRVGVLPSLLMGFWEVN